MHCAIFQQMSIRIYFAKTDYYNFYRRYWIGGQTPSTMSQWLPSKQGNCQNGTAICFYMQTTPETKLVHHRNSQSPQNGGFVIHNNPNLWYSVHKTKSQRACIPVLCNKEEDRFINHQLWFLLDSLSSKPSNHCQNLTNIDPDCIKYRPKT